MNGSYDIVPLQLDDATVDALAQILIDTVAGGGSVSFMHPLDAAVAKAFWRSSLAAAERGERVVFGAKSGDEIIATLTLLLDAPQNQPHRAELAKMMTRPDRRGGGIARALVAAAEETSLERERWMITLDTAEDEGASGFYEKLGYTKAGLLPDYALKPHGGLTGTYLYWKRLAQPGA